MRSEFSAKVTVERAIDDLRRGLPVLLSSSKDKRLFFAAETLNAPIQGLDCYALIHKNRAKFTLQQEALHNVRLTAKGQLDLQKLLCVKHPITAANYKIEAADIEDSCILEILKSSNLLPCALVADLYTNEKTRDEIEQIFRFELLEITKPQAHLFYYDSSVIEICRAPLTLSRANDGEVIVYRNQGRDHLAIIIGEMLNENPLVRIHSSCYTGDILRVLTCDCGEQLRTTINIMLNAGNGIILYLNQEGRGIGLVNKLRTYSLQAKSNMDTVIANEMFGFEPDERNFKIAVNILNSLSIKNLKLMTNNPNKISILEKHGIKVSERISLLCPRNEHNRDYIETKSVKLGHLIE